MGTPARRDWLEWSAQVLGRFIDSVSAAGTVAAAARAAVERAAEVLDADVSAIVATGEVIAAVGYPEGAVPGAELARVPVGTGGWLEVPGAGRCAAAAATLEYPPGATMVVGRAEPGGLTREETSLLRRDGPGDGDDAAGTARAGQPASCP